jgi:hypothetical protein
MPHLWLDMLAYPTRITKIFLNRFNKETNFLTDKELNRIDKVDSSLKQVVKTAGKLSPGQ